MLTPAQTGGWRRRATCSLPASTNLFCPHSQNGPNLPGDDAMGQYSREEPETPRGLQGSNDDGTSRTEGALSIRTLPLGGQREAPEQPVLIPPMRPLRPLAARREWPPKPRTSPWPAGTRPRSRAGTPAPPAGEPPREGTARGLEEWGTRRD